MTDRSEADRASDDLVDRVTLAMMQSEPWSSFWGRADAEKLVRAALAVALEEAARVVDSMAEDLAREFEPSPSIAWVRKNAAAIRAMTPQEDK